jgi:nicotinate-nucleotide adenylyltransferase
MRIGLLGGSFNPAHAGHRHIIVLARQRLRLNQVWLLVSPGNPLKSRRGMALLEQRLASARAIADGRRVIATAIEADWATRYTIDTLRRLLQRFPRVRFVWLMGADILAQLPRWRRWLEFVRRIPIAVLPRPGYNRQALASQAARRFASARRPARSAPRLAELTAPAWVFLRVSELAASASAIRASIGAEP